MSTLIVPMAGKSSRFPNSKPKWMLTHPWSGRFMAIESLMGLNIDKFDLVLFVCLKEHQEKFGFLDGFKRELNLNGMGGKSQILMLDDHTSSQSETVSKSILEMKLKGHIFIKDSDNFYKCSASNCCNEVAYFNLADAGFVNPAAKSYIQLDSNGLLTNIVEKKIISSFFSVGGYGFENSEDFVDTHKKLITETPGEIYVSHVIFEMMLTGSKFKGTPVSDYKDWGTLDDWNTYRRQYRCIFMDIDGVLFENTSDHFSNMGAGKPLTKNIELVRELHARGNTYIILTTSRREEFRELTEQELKEKGVPYDRLIMSLPHCQRLVVNDFSSSNPYPSCAALNLRRDTQDLKDYFFP